MTFRRQTIIYLAVSVVALAINLLTMHHRLPWLDEVMFADTPANYCLYGEWSTRAWYGLDDEHPPFSTYVPLYQFLQVAWIKTVGFSFLRMRLLELLLHALLGWGMLRIICKHVERRSLSIAATMFFSVAFWFMNTLCQIYRMGRVDIGGALMSCILLMVILQYKNRPKSQLLVWFVATLCLMTGIQNAVFIIGIFAFAFLLYPERKQLVQPFLMTCGGFGTGFLLSAAFMWRMGYLKPFMVALYKYSETMQRMYPTIRQLARPFVNLPADTKRSMLKTTHPSLLSRITESISDPSSILLLTALALLIVLEIRRNRRLSPAIGIALAGCFIILFMNIAGRYAVYYRWMHLLPLIMAATLLIQHCKPIIRNTVSTLLMSIFIGLSAHHFLPLHDDCYPTLSAFIHRQHFKPGDRIATTVSTFYDLKPVVKTCYFYDIYPPELIHEPLDYLIVPLPDARSEQKVGYYKAGLQQLRQYIDALKSDSTLHLTLVDSCQYPAMAVYRVEK